MNVTAEPTASRLDSVLVARGLARSRALASEAVRAGRVRVDGLPADKPSRPVDPSTTITVDPDGEPDWVSRSAGKLAPVLRLVRESGVPVPGSRCVDIGASTGGFTQVLLEAGAARVHAVDVGHGQLAESLRRDARVRDLPGLHVRDLTVADLEGEPVDLAVADVSFISVTAVLAVLPAVLTPNGHAIVLVKPQFEAGRGALDKHGILTDPAAHRDVLHRVLDAARQAGLSAQGLWPSAVVGSHGNREYLLWCAAAGSGPGPAVADAIPTVVAAAFGGAA